MSDLLVTDPQVLTGAGGTALVRRFHDNLDGTWSEVVYNGEGATSTATPTSVNSSASAVTLAAANPARKGGFIYNASTAILYILLGTGTPTTSNYSYQVAANSVTPFTIPNGYTGAIQGIWASANGAAKITELS